MQSRCFPSRRSGYSLLRRLDVAARSGTLKIFPRSSIRLCSGDCGKPWCATMLPTVLHRHREPRRRGHAGRRRRRTTGRHTTTTACHQKERYGRHDNAPAPCRRRTAAARQARLHSGLQRSERCHLRICACGVLNAAASVYIVLVEPVMRVARRVCGRDGVELDSAHR